MALDKTKKSNRLLQSRRYTMESSTDAQEAFTRVLDLNATEIYIDQAAIPATGLPYSGTSQNEEFVLSGSADLLKYYYQFTLTPSNVVNGSKTEVFFFISASGHDPTTAVTPQILQAGQQGSFISPKYSDPSLSNADTEDATPGDNVTIRVNGTKQNAANYQFDYKTGVIQFNDADVAPTTGDTVKCSVYQYVARTLNDGLGGGAGFPFSGSAQITGSDSGGFAVTGSSTFDISGTGNEFQIKSAPVQDFPFVLT